jgi:hypothetical protein
VLEETLTPFYFRRKGKVVAEITDKGSEYFLISSSMIWS